MDISNYNIEQCDAVSVLNAIMDMFIRRPIRDSIGVPTMTIPNTTASQKLAPDTLYIFASRASNLTLTLGTPLVGKVSEYHCFIQCGSTAPTITWPSGISWNGGVAPTIVANKTYEISILNNVAAYFEV